MNYPRLKVKPFEMGASCFNDYCTLFLNERMRLAQSPRGLTSRSSYGTKKFIAGSVRADGSLLFLYSLLHYSLYHDAYRKLDMFHSLVDKVILLFL